MARIGSLTTGDVGYTFKSAKAYMANSGEKAVKELTYQIQNARDFFGRHLSVIKSKTHQFLEEHKALFVDAVKEIQRIATMAILAATAFFLFMTNSSLFLFGALYTYFDKERMRDVIHNVTSTWCIAPLPLKVGMVAGGILAWPSVFAVGSFLLGGYTALHIQDFKDMVMAQAGEAAETVEELSESYPTIEAASGVQVKIEDPAQQ